MRRARRYLSQTRRERIPPVELGGGNGAPLDVGESLVLPLELGGGKLAPLDVGGTLLLPLEWRRVYQGTS